MGCLNTTYPEPRPETRAMSTTDATLLHPTLMERPLGALAAALPGATAVFRRHKLDFCCGGQASLADAAAARGIDPAAIAAELAALDPAAAEQAPRAPDELIDLILARYHAVHRRELPELIRLARKVEAVHRGKPGTPAGLAELLERMEDDLVSHMGKEEMILFPLLRSAFPERAGAMAFGPIAMMRGEHDDHGAELLLMAGLTDDLTLPPEACTTFRALYAGLGKFRDDLTQHIHLENNVLFPQFEAAA